VSAADVPRFADFERVVVFTGAGMSAESGVPTYRGAGGIWKSYDYRRYACQDAFDRDPEGVWEFHNYRRRLVGACAPNEGHRLIARAQASLPAMTVVTQNIDGLHQLAGAADVLELHGSLWRLRCEGCGGRTETRDAPLIDVRCACGAFWRPAITWFGDPLDDAVFSAAAEAIAACDLFVAIGTSAVVYPAAALPGLARRGGATMVEINPEETEASGLYSVHLRGTATAMLGRLTGGLTART
jgi:NAD-dependent deacetylase